MSQDLTKKKFAPGSLRRPRTARTLLLRMAADDDRAQRIRDTWLSRKGTDPKRYTWANIAAHVHVTERAAQEWQKTGGIDYDHAQALAGYLEVDFDWLWRGPRDENGTPDPFATARATQVNDGFDEFRQYVRDIRRDIAEARQERTEASQSIEGLLQRQAQVLENIERLLATQDSILREMQRVAGGLPSDDELAGFRKDLEALEARAEAGRVQDDGPSGTAGTSRRQSQGR